MPHFGRPKCRGKMLPGDLGALAGDFGNEKWRLIVPPEEKGLGAEEKGVGEGKIVVGGE